MICPYCSSKFTVCHETRSNNDDNEIESANAMTADKTSIPSSSSPRKTNPSPKHGAKPGGEANDDRRTRSEDPRKQHLSLAP